MYQTGKGINHLVPVQVPEDTLPALRKLAETKLRNQCGINPSNKYIFPSTGDSESNVSGWHSLHRVCIKAQVQTSKVTADKM